MAAWGSLVKPHPRGILETVGWLLVPTVGHDGQCLAAGDQCCFWQLADAGGWWLSAGPSGWERGNICVCSGVVGGLVSVIMLVITC